MRCAIPVFYTRNSYHATDPDHRLLSLLVSVPLPAPARSTTPATPAASPVAASGDFAALVDIGGSRKIYLQCRGTGSLAVSLVGGYRDLESIDLAASAAQMHAAAGQAELATVVPGARHVVATESGHGIQQDKSEVVIDAILQVVEAVRDPASWATDLATPPAQSAGTCPSAGQVSLEDGILSSQGRVFHHVGAAGDHLRRIGVITEETLSKACLPVIGIDQMTDEYSGGSKLGSLRPNRIPGCSST
jgi:hypothetical protein